MALFTQLTGRQTYTVLSLSEIWLVFGRRAGKSLICAFIAVYLAVCRNYRPYLAPGEWGTIMLVAGDRRQTRTLFRYVSGFFDGLPALAARIERRTSEAIYLKNGIVIEVQTRSFRTIRGYSIAGFIGDEIAYWPSDDSANPDDEILNSVRPAMSTIPNALMLCISSPYARRGVLWDSYKQFYGVEDSEVLVMQAPSRVMNPTLSEKFIAAAYARDAPNAAAEYGAQFRTDIERFLSLERIAACVVTGRTERLPEPGIEYRVFVDPSGGSQDSYTLAVAHGDGTKAVLDCMREVRPPFSPEQVTREFAELAKAYGCDEVTGDRYAGEWPREQFRKWDIHYVCSDLAKSDIYRELLPLINAEAAELLDVPVLAAQLAALERRTARGGRDTIDHSPSGRDDLINAAAGALVAVSRPRARFEGCDPRPDVELEIPTVTRGEGENRQEIDQAVLRSMASGNWFR